ncbi:cell division protein FtsZ [Ferrimonas marina]|uniref:Cell division protein FtsZ n=1 Tax=Ferrimonas marina TaxID=299255 RepID=A0A1M5TGQ1_9GAMM|nr:cell division protein FtsZ [Ferrimonas marina]SHH49894.1 cell division protein FtsZ [Ferrimonas marina]
MFEIQNDETVHDSRIKVVGVGGAGNNALGHMVAEKIHGVTFSAINTDNQVLTKCQVDNRVLIGQQTTRGRGAGCNPDVGKIAAEENRDEIERQLEGASMVFIAAGMGGGTGTGAAPVVAKLAREKNILTVAVVTKPFSFEGDEKRQLAEEGLRKLGEVVDSLIVLPNDKIMKVMDKKCTLVDAFKEANSVLCGAVTGISDLVTRTGFMNVDFSDVKTVMTKYGMSMMGTGYASGEDRARLACQAAISSPLLEDVDLSGAKGVLVNITCRDLGLMEFDEIGQMIREKADRNATIKIGSVVSDDLEDEDGLKVTVVATGLESPYRKSLTMEEHPDVSLESRGAMTATRQGQGVEKPSVMPDIPGPSFLKSQRP